MKVENEGQGSSMNVDIITCFIRNDMILWVIDLETKFLQHVEVRMKVKAAENVQNVRRMQESF